MPTEALETLLNRDLSNVAGKDARDINSPLLQELVNYATNVYGRCSNSPIIEENKDAAVLILYLHITEMVDGVEVLISQSCPTPAIPLIRSAFEAILAIEYILEKDIPEKDYVNRSLAWLAAYTHERISSYERLDPATKKGQEYEKIRAKDQLSKTLEIFPALNKHQLEQARSARATLEQMLAKPQFEQIETERKNHKGKPKWYQLFGGPSTLELLARYLNRGAEYEMFYRKWSATTHASDLSRFVERLSQADPTIRVIRDFREIRIISLYAASFILTATHLILRKFHPGENVDVWYKREIRTRYLGL